MKQINFREIKQDTSVSLNSLKWNKQDTKYELAKWRVAATVLSDAGGSGQ